MFYRERGALPYDPFAYGVAIALVEIPYLLIQVSSCIDIEPCAASRSLRAKCMLSEIAVQVCDSIISPVNKLGSQE